VQRSGILAIMARDVERRIDVMTLRRWIFASIAAVGLGMAALPLLPGLGGTASPTALEAAGVCDGKGRKAPEFSLKDINGKNVRLADYQGKVVLINFWATWCPPCKHEIPIFVDLQQRYRDQGLVFLGISVDDPVDVLKPFVSQWKMNYPVLVGLGREDVQDAYGPMFGIPVTIVVSRSGQVCTRYFGLRSKQKLEDDIKALL
jgi:peroxiredoxin